MREGATMESKHYALIILIGLIGLGSGYFLKPDYPAEYITDLENNKSRIQTEYESLNEKYSALIEDHEELLQNVATIQDAHSLELMNLTHQILKESASNVILEQQYAELGENLTMLQIEYNVLIEQYNLPTETYHLDFLFNDVDELNSSSKLITGIGLVSRYNTSIFEINAMVTRIEYSISFIDYGPEPRHSIVLHSADNSDVFNIYGEIEGEHEESLEPGRYYLEIIVYDGWLSPTSFMIQVWNYY
jgi:hypothetical protein